MRLLLATVLVLCAASTAQAATLVTSKTWRPMWTSLAFPLASTDTPQQITRWVQLPDTVQAGDVVLVVGREEFMNPTWGSQGAWTVSGVVSEHWSTPIMRACGLKKAASLLPDPNSWSWIGQQTAENFTGLEHHSVWVDDELFLADGDDAGDYVAVVCYFSRSLYYRDLDADYVVAHPTYGKIEAAVIG